MRGRTSPCRAMRRSSSMPTGRCIRRCARASSRCGCGARSRSCRSPAPTTSRAATSRRRTRSSSASRSTAARGYESGFMNRLAGVLGAVAPDRVHRSDAARLPRPSRARAGRQHRARRRRPEAGGGRPRQSALIAEMYRDSSSRAPVSEASPCARACCASLGGEMEAASRNAINARGFELQARRIARLMRDRVQPRLRRRRRLGHARRRGRRAGPARDAPRRARPRA